MDLEIPLSGMQAQSLVLEVAAHDVANVSTPGFEPSRVILEEQAGGGVAVAAIVPENSLPAPLPSPDETSSALVQVSGTDLAAETVSMISAQRAFEAQAVVVRAEDQMLGTFINTAV
jgi:flagellar basal-body rod protein FlgC